MKAIKLNLLALGLFGFIFTGCDKSKDPEPTKKGTKLPIVLDCNYFNEDRILVDDPEADVDYIIKCIMEVKADIKVEPGVVIEFEQEAGIKIEESSSSKASFSAIGSSSKPIIFRGTNNEKGFWTGLRFASRSTKNELNHVIIEDAGYYNKFGKEWSGGIRANASNLKITNSTISNCVNYGVNIDSKDNEIIFKNNTITKSDIPLKTHPNQLGVLDATSSYKGNVNDYIFVNGYGAQTGKDFTWHKVDVPYKVNADPGVNSMVIYGNMTVEAGVEIIMTANSWICLGNLEKKGSFVMKGTPSNKIIIRGEENTKGYWRNLYIRSNSTKNEMAYVEIRDAGHVSSDPNTVKSAIYLSGAYLNIHDSKFTNLFECAITSKHSTILVHNNLELEGASCLISTP